jgi:uncharacterized protein with NAD-binding domain and iron-sulfur cluster
VTATRTQAVLILGCGPAGLTAAYRLLQQGFRVTLIDQAQEAGGSLSARPYAPVTILECHLATWSLLRSLGPLLDGRQFQQAALEFRIADGRLVRFPSSRLPAPLHVLSSIGRFTGLSWKERWTLISWLEQLWEGSAHLAGDLEHRTAADWLTSIGQHRSLQRSIWNPLAEWLTGAELHALSAKAFVATLTPVFLARSTGHRISLPSQTWNEALIQPMLHALSGAGATILLGAQAVQFHYEHDRVTGVRLKDGSLQQADRYIAALPPHQLTPILPERWLSRFAYFQHITELVMLPSAVVQVKVTSSPISPLSPRLILLADGPFRWVLVRPSGIGHTLCSLALARDQAMNWPHSSQAYLTLQSLGLLVDHARPGTPVQENLPHVSLSLRPGADVQRPIQKSPICNLFLAGAWTDTGWPANLESAITSGDRAADMLTESVQAC